MFQGITYDLAQPMKEARALGLFTSLCTISRLTGAIDNLGQVAYSTAAPVAGLTNIPCQISVQRDYTPNQSGVIRQPEGFDTISERHVLLNNYYPGIQQSDLATVDGVAYEIMAVEADSQKKMTRLAARFYQK